MSEPLYIGDLFKLDPKNWEVSFDGTVLLIDNFYADPNSINAWLSKQDYPRWKYYPEIAPTRNGIDYDDCRLRHVWPSDTMRINETYFDEVLTYLRKYFGDVKYQHDSIFEFNCFRAIKDLLPQEQHYPHFDRKCLNMVIYMDKGGNGGTNLYIGDFPEYYNNEHENLIFDYDSIEYDVLTTIPYKFNRAAIFDGRRMHGAFIEDYNHYKNNWRYTQVYFFRLQD